MQDFEKLGVFYLGREYDFEKQSPKESLLLYDSRDLVTHAVCIGMTGSGKTGLCISLLEEAAIDGVPSIAIDPKGDLANILLSFPGLTAEEFRPWINEQDAERKGVSPDEYAGEQADLWKKGLADWGQDGSRIRRLQEAAEFSIYTPGSTAGLQVSILKSFSAPQGVLLEDGDLLRERINTTVTSLLSLIGIKADPVTSREHILLSNLFESAWREGRDLDLAGLIDMIQSPPFSRIGVFDIESFYPSDDRFALAMKLNNLLAAPGFKAWLEGEPLDIGRMLYTDEGKPRVSVFSIAHLNDGERMFFVSLLLSQLVGWMRSQSGTSSLRSIFYMDEIFGFFPPVANPPSKGPLLSLLKQARAFGLGIVLSTQNPVDLDYKGLSNTGTWFLGRLQTEQDKERVLDGLEGASSSAGGRFNRRKMDLILSGLGKRVFLMNNVHEDQPVVFQSRWALSYLRGPLTRNQIRLLMEEAGTVRAAAAEPSAQSIPGPAGDRTPAVTSRPSKPLLPPEISQYFVPVSGQGAPGSKLMYEPRIMAVATIYLADDKAGITEKTGVSMLADFSRSSSAPDWDQAEKTSLAAENLKSLPDEESALFGELPREAGLRNTYLAWGKAFQEWIYRNRKLELLQSPSLGIVSAPGESERDFRIRLQQASREKRDELVEQLRKKYTARIVGLEDRIMRARQAVEREKEQSKQQKFQTAISLGATLVTALLGRKRISQSTLGRAATTAHRAGRVMKESKDIDRATETMQSLEERLLELQNALAAETEQIRAGIDPLAEKLEPLVIQPKKKDIMVTFTALTWVPFWLDERGGIMPAG